MTATILPAMTVHVRLEDASVDLICFEYARGVLGDARQAGKLVGYVEATLAANPGLADLGPVLPLGQLVRLPAFIIAQERSQIRLWTT